MSNAALFLHPDAYDTTGKSLLGRHSAGESFLRGFLRHADLPQYYFWNAAGRPQPDLEGLLARIEPPKKPVTWIGQTERLALAGPGVVNIPSPEIDAEAWLRQPYGARRYALCGVTHTTATGTVMKLIPELLIAPLEDHDALVCTSTAVRESVETQLSMMRDYLADSFGGRRRPEPQRVTIPLGVNASDFAVSDEHRKAWRERLDIPEDALVALYVGRFNMRAKMNPALMAVALERAAQRTGKAIYWVNSGWMEPGASADEFHEETAKLCPTVAYRQVDGRPADVRFTIWSVADLFISFSDNIQETFGLTPVEAMAAGLPCVVSDWDGYRDTVRDGVDGFRVPTVAPRPGLGGDLAYWFANKWLTYDNYVGAVGQYTAVDLARAEVALSRLIDSPDLRRRMGAAARQRAHETFDWSVVIPQYQALWTEQNARRQAATATFSGANPYRPDPFILFQGYPTRHIARSDVVALRPGMDWPAVKMRLDGPMARYSRFNRPTQAECETVLTHLAQNGPTPVGRLLELFPPARRNYLERGLIWLARYDVVALAQA